MTRKIACILFVVCICFFPWHVDASVTSTVAGWLAGGAESMISSLLMPIGYLLLQVSAFALWLSGIILNLSISIAVINFGEFVKKITVVAAGWQAIRDILNIFFVVALLKAGFDKILGNGGNVVEVIKNLIIAAIGINFSILIATTCIDVSNAFGLHYYRYVIGERQTISLDGGITGQVMDSLGLATFWNMGSKPAEADLSGAAQATNLGNTLTSGKGFAYFLLASVMLLMLAFTFALAAILFLYRAITVIVLLITAPFAFAGYIMPEFKSQQDSWWKNLTTACTWPPIYFMALYVGMQVIRSGEFKSALGAGSTDISFALLLQGKPEGILPIFNFVVVLVILNGALLVANKYGPEGLAQGKKLAHRFVTGAAGSALSFGAAGARKGYSGALRAGGALANRATGGRTSLGLTSLANYSEKKSWDVRNIPGFPENAGVLGVTGEQVGFGKPGEYFEKKSSIFVPKTSDLIGPDGDRLRGVKDFYKNNLKQAKEVFTGDEKTRIDEAVADAENITEASLASNNQFVIARDAAKRAFITAQNAYKANPTDQNKYTMNSAQEDFAKAEKLVENEIQVLKVQRINQAVSDPTINREAKKKVGYKDAVDEAVNETEHINEATVARASATTRAKVARRDAARQVFLAAQGAYAANPTTDNKNILDRAQEALSDTQKDLDKDIQNAKVEYINRNVSDPSTNKKAKDKVANKDEAEEIKKAALRFKAEDALRPPSAVDPRTPVQKVQDLFLGPVTPAGGRDLNKGIKGSDIKTLIEAGSSVFNIPAPGTSSLFLDALTNRHLDAIKGAEIDDTIKRNIADYFGSVVPVPGGTPPRVWAPRAGFGTASAQNYFSNNGIWTAWGL